MMKKKLLARSVVLGLLCASVFGTSAWAESLPIDVPSGTTENRTNLSVQDTDFNQAIINNGVLNLQGNITDISNTGSLVANVPDHDSYFLVRNLGTININSQTLDIDNHFGLAIHNDAGGNINIRSNNFFIGTDFCCNEHQTSAGPADGHVEDPSRHRIILNNGTLVIDGGPITDNTSVQLIQGKIIHGIDATTNISIYGSNRPYDLNYIIQEMVNYRDIPTSGFVGTVVGSSDDGFSISLNSTACWMAGKQNEKINQLNLNGGAIVVGDINLSFTESVFGDPESRLNPREIWPENYKTLKVRNFNSDGNFYNDSIAGNFAKTEGIYVFTDLKNNQGDRIVFTGQTPNKTIPLGIVNKDDNNGEPIRPGEHRVTVVTAPANTQMSIKPSLIVYGNELNKLYGRSLTVRPFDVYTPVLITEYADGEDGQVKNWVFTGWGVSGGKTVGGESDQVDIEPTINAVEHDITFKRINDIRTDPSEIGVWLRGESGKMKIRSYSYDYNIMSGGYDWDYDSNAAKMFLGFGISYAKNDCDTGIIGNTKSMGYNLYGSWLGKENKDYVDVIVKYGTLDKDYAGFDDNNVFVTGEYYKNLFSIAAKYGRRIDREDGWYFEPSVGLTWGRIGSADYTDSQGIKIHADSSTSKMASLGVQVGKNVKGTEYYGKFEVRHDFDGKMHVSVPGSNLPGSSVYDDMGGTWYKVGIGAARKIDKNNSFYIDIEKDFGNKVKKPYSIGAGYRYTW